MKALPVITLILGFTGGALVALFYGSNDFYYHVKQSVFDECFQYHAEADKNEGIAESTISMCIDKANDWGKRLKK